MTEPLTVQGVAVLPAVQVLPLSGEAIAALESCPFSPTQTTWSPFGETAGSWPFPSSIVAPDAIAVSRILRGSRSAGAIGLGFCSPPSWPAPPRSYTTALLPGTNCTPESSSPWSSVEFVTSRTAPSFQTTTFRAPRSCTLHARAVRSGEATSPSTKGADKIASSVKLGADAPAGRAHSTKAAVARRIGRLNRIT